MRALLVLLISFFSLVSVAQESRLKVKTPESPAILKAYLLGIERRYEKTSGLEWEERKPLNLAVGFQKKQLDFVMEYSQFKINSGNATLNIDRDHQEVVAWGRFHFLSHDSVDARWTMYAGLGIGGYEESITTNTSGSSQTDKGGVQWMSGVSAGIETQVHITTSFGFVGALEGRILTAADFDPNPLGSGVLRLGLFFDL